jgi:hypothetical protein
VVQAFWVREGGRKPRWERDKTKKPLYVRTADKWWNRWHWKKSPIYIPPWEGGKLSVNYSELDLTLSTRKKEHLRGKVITDLKKIQETDSGRKLLKALGKTGARHKTSILAEDPEQHKAPIASSTGGKFDPEVGSRTEIYLPSGAEIVSPGEAEWDPTSSDTVLYHELVHAYHNVMGTSATGTVTETQAIDEVDVGQNLSEYQAVGLNTADGAGETQFAGSAFSENKYRGEQNMPPRDTYLPRED